MDLIILILGIALIGFAVWAVTKYIPMDQIFKIIIYIIAGIVMTLWLINRFNVMVPNVMP